MTITDINIGTMEWHSLTTAQKLTHIEHQQTIRHQHFLASTRPIKKKKRTITIKKVFKDNELQQIFERMNAKERRLLS